jgi:hypothetical protein
MSMNAHGITKIFAWRVTKNHADLEEAANEFKNIISSHKNYAPAYFNLAVCQAQDGVSQYDNVIANLLSPVKSGNVEIGIITRRLHEDAMTRTEQFFTPYVITYLNVGLSESDPSWSRSVENALREKGKTLNLLTD